MSQNLFHVVPALQSTVLVLIRSLADHMLEAFIVWFPLQFLVSLLPNEVEILAKGMGSS